MTDGRITQAAAFCKLFLAPSSFLSEELDAKTDVFEKLGFICCVTFLLVYERHPFATNIMI